MTTSPSTTRPSPAFTLSVKLPYTSEVALDLPFARPTGYGLGKWGWVSFAPADGEIPPLEQLKDWVEESYRAQAPRKLVWRADSMRSGTTPSPAGTSATIS
jgi:hypothetical protein